MSTVTIVRTWSVRYKAWQVQINEDGFHQNWVAVGEIRKLSPTLRSDVQLKNAHSSGFETFDQSSRLFSTNAH